ncbi:protein translocase subunit SecF [Glycomyces harbinensis]|uniref:Protein-export membrane protein SecF n=1 Tax=Glycomyces harbinensis TaxID=58114 RepID=A0A1G7BA66_9ACTN|nr:protein translocase subunit SecF [Glycomyces harbinensis]SDE23710.1 preprotein translocase subunit SecF [Glycomyces harbinensis]
MSTKQTEKRPGILSQLYRGETNFQFVANRRKYYLASALVIGALAVIMIVKGFVLGIDFAGGIQYSVPAGDTSVSLEDVEGAAEAAGAEVASGQVAGSGDGRSYIVRVGELDTDQAEAVRAAIADEAGIGSDSISVSEVSATWGASVSEQALIALVVFLVLVAIFIWIRFERRMAVAAIAALLHDLVLTAGFYSLVGFEITPSTIVGMLTILGYSLYDTVVVFDKVQENTAQLLQTRSKTFAEGVNDAVNQTLMRSINTTIIGVLPVAALLFVGVGVLGVGTLKDLALVLFVGMIVGTYSSIFLASPWLVDMAERSAVYQRHNQKIAAKRAGEDGTDKPARKNARTASDDDDEDDDRLVLAKTDEIPLELIDEPAPAKAGAGPRSGGSNTRSSNAKKRKRR